MFDLFTKAYLSKNVLYPYHTDIIRIEDVPDRYKNTKISRIWKEIKGS